MMAAESMVKRPVIGILVALYRCVFQHRVPILVQHHASAASTPVHQPTRHEYGDTLHGDVLTHVDPQHVAASTLAVSDFKSPSRYTRDITPK